ncbi:radical SAM family heme chaperone HemW [Thiofilum flexile]|uniref:radical SAM family heme chaperone HemW n=1 Tax=Thiofilum flexile TaxID=125627 RepID=UPI00036BC305
MMQAIPLALYIHIPWCVRKCPYCDFNSHAAPQSLPESLYIDALLADLAQELPTIWGRRLESVFIGGGTPSLFSPEALDRLLSGIRALLPLRPSLEITLEANPGTFEQDKFKAYRELGINRLSIGIQSFHPEHLQVLGRIHNRNEALRAAEIARIAGFDNFNLDLMFALPEQTLEQALADLNQAIDLQPTHLSWYQLTLEPNTLFAKYPPHLPDEDLSADIQQAGQALLASAGFNQYEVSAYAQTGRECRHNRNYWEFGDYIGIGAGAHGKISHYETDGQLTITRYQKARQPDLYMQSTQTASARTQVSILAQEHLGFEFMLNTLRLKQGFRRSLWEERTGVSDALIQPPLAQAAEQGLIQSTTDWIKPTELGWHFLNNAMELFLPIND